MKRKTNLAYLVLKIHNIYLFIFQSAINNIANENGECINGNLFKQDVFLQESLVNNNNRNN